MDRIPTSYIEDAAERLKEVALHTPLQYSSYLSEKYACKVYLKREDLQIVRSYKLRGAYNKMALLTDEERSRGIVCASAGNHSQGVAFSCAKLKVKGTIFMPKTTPTQKLNKVRKFGKTYIDIVLVGDTFDDAYKKAVDHGYLHGLTFVHPFDDFFIMAGQGTVGKEIWDDMHRKEEKIDALFLPIGGGGLVAGVGSYFANKSPQTDIIGVEPLGAPAMKQALCLGKVVELDTIDKFVDGAAVKSVGAKTFDICQKLYNKNLEAIRLVDEGKVCSTILELYNEEGMVVEPAGALSIAALEEKSALIKGNTVVCIVSGGNNDILRMEEIKEKSLAYEGLKHYFIVSFPQRAGALKEFVNYILSPTDDITLFEYTKKTNKEQGPALVGIEVKKPEDFDGIVERMEEKGFGYQLRKQAPDIFKLLV